MDIWGLMALIGVFVVVVVIGGLLNGESPGNVFGLLWRIAKKVIGFVIVIVLFPVIIAISVFNPKWAVPERYKKLIK
ncbi:hypothetical protein [Paenibacillus spongiae]|uniref:Uncharacterized protein n=1 Tax=Paenibacillus spongiae TaxID=2909671 RepID=A0ABY5SCG4_9BACL|nr:hypothetical protein [Paenibacillus spongiae]UVI31223.1 hypothetical protein L1F29_05100 [Paenibacillus spongiae]